MKKIKKTMNIRELLEASGSLRKIAVQDIPGPVAYREALIIKDADVHLELYEEQYAKALAKHCAQEKDGRWKANSPEDKAAFEEAVKELQEIEVELEIPVCTIRLPDVKVSGIDIIALDGLIVFEDEEEKEEDNAGHHDKRDE